MRQAIIIIHQINFTHDNPFLRTIPPPTDTATTLTAAYYRSTGLSQKGIWNMRSESWLMRLSPHTRHKKDNFTAKQSENNSNTSEILLVQRECTQRSTLATLLQWEFHWQKTFSQCTRSDTKKDLGAQHSSIKEGLHIKTILSRHSLRVLH